MGLAFPEGNHFEPASSHYAALARKVIRAVPVRTFHLASQLLFIPGVGTATTVRPGGVVLQLTCADHLPQPDQVELIMPEASLFRHPFLAN